MPVLSCLMCGLTNRRFFLCYNNRFCECPGRWPRTLPNPLPRLSCAPPPLQSELRHGPFYYAKQPALNTDPVDTAPQDGRNDFYCWLCHREGQVLCCELCPRVYHAKCLKLPAEPEGDWFCPECEVLLAMGE